MRNVVHLSKKAEKGIRQAPPHVQQKTAFWRMLVETQGLRKAKLVKGFHDEPLKGTRKGQHSIRLNLQWRAIYETRIGTEGKETIELVDVVDVTPHKY
ncbi:MAG: hypothetical protein HYW48_01560 [Deltaproteobacteria bacterium]|nr:hypothetical protein [Deltaproteobacteria bacterium]